MVIQPVQDLRLVTETIKHPRIWNWVSDDNSSKASFQANDAMLWLGAYDKEYMGCFGVHPENSVMWQIHTCLLPEAWGRSLEAAELVIQWMFNNTKCRKLITLVPVNNTLALRLAKKAGMTMEGKLTRSFLKNGVLLDQHILGICGE